jgi:DNA replication and repair protein RecF
VEQTSAREYLEVARVVWFSNQDLEIVRGTAERRRRFLDFVAAQHDSGYRRNLRAFAKALRSRNLLLKAPRPAWREIDAFDDPLTRSANFLFSARRRMIESLIPAAQAAQHAVGGRDEALLLEYRPGAGGDYAAALGEAREEDRRLRQTTVGPHRDDFGISLNGQDSGFASEGQQRTVALALRLAEARLIRERLEVPPVLLIDDIFGELDLARRNALLQHFPSDSQRFVTTTHLDWATDDAGWDRRLRLRGGTLE